MIYNRLQAFTIAYNRLQTFTIIHNHSQWHLFFFLGPRSVPGDGLTALRQRLYMIVDECKRLQAIENDCKRL